MQFNSVGIAGLGLLGRGIAACLLSRNIKVVGYTQGEHGQRDAQAHIDHALHDLVDRGGLPASLLTSWKLNYTAATSPNDFAECDFVIESVTEDFEIKQKLFDQIEAVVGASTPVGSNTSALPISQLQSRRKHPNRFIGMHWAEPCHLTRFLEIVRGQQTDDATVAATVALGKAAGKDPTIVRKDVEGFIVNRLGYALYREAFWLLENGVADVETIDRAFRNAISVWGNIAGPFRWMDLTGVPAYAAVMKRLWPQLSTATEVPKLMREMVDCGAHGISTGRGFYDYTPEQAKMWEERLTENVWRVREIMRDLFPEETVK